MPAEGSGTTSGRGWDGERNNEADFVEASEKDREAKCNSNPFNSRPWLLTSDAAY